MSEEARVRGILEASPRFLAALAVLARVGPPDAWLGAGAVRNRVWHALHGLPGDPPESDLDVAWAGSASSSEDARWEARLKAALDAPWEVVDQRRYGHASAEAGIASWPETATGVAARRREGRIELFAAYGWGDLLDLVVRPIPGFPPGAWADRVAKKRWTERFPRVRVTTV